MDVKRLPENIKDTLSRKAARIRSDQPSIPVLLRQICEALRIRVKRQSIVPPGKAYLSWDRAAEAAPTILLPTEPHKTWDRFCAAHELGHFVLISEYEWLPKDQKGYWQTEDLCDHFARELLLPSAILRLDAPTVIEPGKYIDVCDNISRRALVPWAQVAYKVTETASVFFMVFDSSPRGGLRVTSSSLAKKQGNRTEVDKESKLTQLVEAARSNAIGEGRSLDLHLDRSAFKDTKLAPLFRRLGVELLTLRVSDRSPQSKLAAIVSAL